MYWNKTDMQHEWESYRHYLDFHFTIYEIPDLSNFQNCERNGTITCLEIVSKFFSREWNCNETKAVEEYCWAITHASGQSYCGRSSSIVLWFGFKPNCPAYTDIKIKVVPLHAKQALRGIRGTVLQILDIDARTGWWWWSTSSSGSFTPWKESLYPLHRRRSGSHSHSDGSGKSRPHRIYINNWPFLYSFQTCA